MDFLSKLLPFLFFLPFLMHDFLSQKTGNLALSMYCTPFLKTKQDFFAQAFYTKTAVFPVSESSQGIVSPQKYIHTKRLSLLTPHSRRY